MGPAWQRGESDAVESVPSGVRANGGRSARPRAWAELSGMGRFAGEGKGPVGAGERAGLAPGLGLRWRASWAGVGRPDWVGLFWVFLSISQFSISKPN